MRKNYLKDIRLGFRALDVVPEGRLVISISVFLNAPIKVRVGRLAPEFREVLLFEFSLSSFPSPNLLPCGKGFNVSYYDIEGIKYIGIVRTNDGTLEIYERMLEDVCSYVLDDEGLSNKVRMKRLLDRVRDWQAFMGRKKQGLSKKEELGLLGELLILRELLDVSLPQDEAVKFWRGPMHGLHDFEISGSAIEVKTAVSDDSMVIDIFEVNQFDPSLVSALYLFALRMTPLENGESLNSVIEEIKQILSNNKTALSTFEHTLSYTGYRLEEADQYDLSLAVAEVLRLRIDENFPSIRRADLPKGVFDVNYSLDLSFVRSEKITLEQVLLELGVLINGID